MWCPDGYYSWNDVLTWLQKIVEDTISLVCVDGVPQVSASGKLSFTHSQEFYLKKRAGAASHQEAELIVGLTTVLMLVELLETFPPYLVDVSGKKLRPEWPLLCHRDQIENCYFDWPLKNDTSFSGFFEIAESKRFDLEALLSRFAFIDPYFGAVGRRNGDRHYLINGLGLNDEFAETACKKAAQLDGFSLYWDELPEGADLREFLTCIEVNDVFSTSLDYLYGARPTEDVTIGQEARSARIGRPRQRDDAARTYMALYPDGHDALALSWKHVLRTLSQMQGRAVSLATLRRGLLEANLHAGQSTLQK